MNQTIKTLVFWAVIVISAGMLWQTVRFSPQSSTPEISYSQFAADAEAGKIAKVTVSGTEIKGQYRDGQGMFRLVGPSNPAVYVNLLHDKGVEIWFHDPSAQSLPLQLLGTWAPLTLLGALWFFMIRQMRRRNMGQRSASPGAPGSYGESR